MRGEKQPPTVMGNFKMKQTFTIILLFFFVNLFSQKQILEDFDFESGKYALYLIDVGKPELLWERDSIGRLIKIDTTGHFYTNDLSVLNRIKIEWVGDTVEYINTCWYDYFIYLTKDDSTVLKMRVNLECEELIVEGFPYKINPTIVTKFFPELKRLKKRVFNCDDYTDGRDFWKKVMIDKQFVLKDISKPNWIDYDGYFTFDYVDTLRQGLTPVKEQLKNEISYAYPNEDFKIEWGAVQYMERYGGDDYLFRLNCNRSLYDKFSLYEKAEWTEFTDLKIILYWEP